MRKRTDGRWRLATPLAVHLLFAADPRRAALPQQQSAEQQAIGIRPKICPFTPKICSLEPGTEGAQQAADGRGSDSEDVGKLDGATGTLAASELFCSKYPATAC